MHGWTDGQMSSQADKQADTQEIRERRENDKAKREKC